jgi:hypothetical protein
MKNIKIIEWLEFIPDWITCLRCWNIKKDIYKKGITCWHWGENFKRHLFVK